MFGFLLFVFGLVEAIVSGNPRIRWFATASFGLAITLLSRPVLQYIILGVLALLLVVYVASRMRLLLVSGAYIRKVFHRAACAMLFALILPALVIVKNGIYFDSWSIGTGAGAGLYYGVHPLHMGEEPFYTNFQYDIGRTASTINPATRGNLEVEADRWQKDIALHMIAQTSLVDNIKFFASKARAWLLYSPAEHYLDREWRGKRQAMVILIGAAVLLLLHAALRRGGGAVIAILEQLVPPSLDHKSPYQANLVASSSQAKGMLFCCAALLALILGMIIQFLPILYNARYNGVFLDPLFVILASVGLAVLTRDVRLSLTSNNAASDARFKWRRAAGQIFLMTVLIYAHKTASNWSMRHERLSPDPYRLGPATVVLDGDAFGAASSIGMKSIGENEWIITGYPSELVVPVNIPPGLRVGSEEVYEAIWRIRLQLRGIIPSACRDVEVSYSRPENPKSPLPPRVFLSRGGEMRTYAFSGGFSMRPRDSGELRLKFTCPIGTQIKWGGAELLSSTLAEASRELIKKGAAFFPYQSYDPRLPNPR